MIASPAVTATSDLSKPYCLSAKAPSLTAAGSIDKTYLLSPIWTPQSAVSKPSSMWAVELGAAEEVAAGVVSVADVV